MNPVNLFLIPARSGSKGLPGKNTKLLGAKTLIEYSIDFALENFTNSDELCISTNDDLVLEIAKKRGITIPFIRPDQLSNDTASSYDVIMHALNHYETINKKFDAVLLLQPTSPFRKNEDLQSLIKEFDKNVDMVVSVKIAKENMLIRKLSLLQLLEIIVKLILVKMRVLVQVISVEQFAYVLLIFVVIAAYNLLMQVVLVEANNYAPTA